MQLESPRVLWVAALTIVVAMMAVLAVREVAVRKANAFRAASGPGRENFCPEKVEA
jgi:hypothetical protein